MLLSLVLCTPAPGTPVAAPTPVVWSGAPARSIRLDEEQIGIDTDGKARWVVKVRFLDATGQPTKLVSAGDVEFAASSGEVQWQTRTRYGGPAAIVTTTHDGPLSVRAYVKQPAGIADARAETDTRTWQIPRVTAGALGPHAVQIGWFPAASAPVEVFREGPEGRRRVCVAQAGASTCRDASVRPGSVYAYIVRRGGRSSAPPNVTVPPAAPKQSLAAFRGKGMWLQFSPVAGESDGYDKLDAAAIVARAKAAGIRYIELRTAYGEFSELTQRAKPYVDALIDAAARNDIAVFAWTVPRAASFDDIALAASHAAYRTPNGTRVAGLAVDLERGDEYMGDGPRAAAAMAAYVRTLRLALGPSSVIVATVEDPFLAGLTNRDVPYAAIARDADALQPMTYWRMFRNAIDPAGARAAIVRSLTVLRRETGRALPVNVGGQTSGIGPCGAPPGDELTATLTAARSAGAVGETFFDWFGTADVQWNAIGSFTW